MEVIPRRSCFSPLWSFWALLSTTCLGRIVLPRIEPLEDDCGRQAVDATATDRGIQLTTGIWGPGAWPHPGLI